MSDQPNPAGEWTAATVSKLIDEASLSGVADAHNATLNTDRMKLAATVEVNALLQRGIELRDNQLAAERDALEVAQTYAKSVNNVNDQLRSQLAAAQAAFVKLKSAIRDVHWHGKPLSETLNIDITDTAAREQQL